MSRGYIDTIREGEKLGNYTVIKEVAKAVYKQSTQRRVAVRCGCGFEREITYATLKAGKSKRCRGCFAKFQRERYMGEKNPMFGKTHSDEVRQKIREAPKSRGENHHAWRGGMQKWFRRQVLKRDKNTCSRCGLKDVTPGFMEVDHIEPKALSESLRFDVENGMTLCPNCHRRKTIIDMKRIREVKPMPVFGRIHEIIKQ